MTNEEIVKELEKIEKNIPIFPYHPTLNYVLAVVKPLISELSPKPKFKVGDFVFEDCSNNLIVYKVVNVLPRSKYHDFEYQVVGKAISSCGDLVYCLHESSLLTFEEFKSKFGDI